MGLAAPSHVQSSGTRDRTHIPCIARQIPNRWTTGGVPDHFLHLETFLHTFNHTFHFHDTKLLNTELPYDQVIPSLYINPKQLKEESQTDMFTAMLLTINQKLETT